MPNIDKTSLRSELETFYATIDNTTCIKDVLLTADAHYKISESWASSIPCTCDLPDMCNSGFPIGHMVWVEELNCHVVSGEYGWYDMDGTLARQDIPYTEAYVWGRPSYLAEGSKYTCSPVATIDGFKDWISIKQNGGFGGIGLTGELGVSTTIWQWGILTGTYGYGVSKYTSPVSLNSGFTDWCCVTLGGFGYEGSHALGVRDNGTLWAWGGNIYGQLGNNCDGYGNGTISPVSVLGGFTDWTQAAGGKNHSVGLRNNGTIWTWGSNCYGALGNDLAGYCSSSSPVSVVGGFTDWCKISAGSFHNAAIRTNGTLWTWGAGGVGPFYGQLGDGTKYNRSSPVSVVGGFTDWCQVSAGVLNTAAIRTNGTLWTWGNNYYGQLGINDCVGYAFSSPVSVVGGFTDWCQVAVGPFTMLALKADGTAWGWGANYGAYSSGAVGDGTKYDRSSPVSVAGGFTDWIQIDISNIGYGGYGGFFTAASSGIRLVGS